MLKSFHETGRRVALGLALLAMLAQVGTIMLYGQGQTISSTQKDESGLLTMVICSPTGLKQITIDNNGKIVDEKTPDKNNLECPYSAALASNNLVPPAQTALVMMPSTDFQIYHFISSTLQLASISFLASPGRSPPIDALVSAIQQA